jgi:ubiquinone/menaquinone biosynthesis C-methylase UbiE
MNLVEEYINQNSWRDWDFYLQKLPINNHDTICDMGCSIGVVTKKLANKAYKVFGIDNNFELIEEAKKINTAENISYLTDDINTLNYQKLPLCEGIWSSFVAAYFPNFTSVLNNWESILKPNGWLGIVEMSSLFSHEPLSQSTRKIFEKYYLRQQSNNSYDFEMGSKLKDFMIKSGLSIIHEENVFDIELAFNGPAEPQIIKSWENRFDRMFRFKEYVGEKKFDSIKNEFLLCLADKNHKSNTIVKFIIAMK